MNNYCKLAGLILTVALTYGTAQPVYKSLTKKERENFIATSLAFQAAMAEHNYHGIEKFGPAVLEDYASIELDPDCKDLRPAYNEIRSIILSSRLFATRDSLIQSVEYAFLGNNWRSCLEKYQPFLSFLQEQHLDSIFKLHFKRLGECQSNFASQAPELESIETITRLRFYDKDTLKALNKRLEVKTYQAFLNASTTLNRDSLLAFKARYPNLFARDLQTLLEKTQQKHRLSLMRNPSKDAIVDYYSIYPKRDVEIDHVFENLLFQAFLAAPSQVTGNEYLLAFPEGRRAGMVRSGIITLQADTTSSALNGSPVQPYPTTFSN